MDLELKIENFGPIDKATIQVGQFTVFAGAEQHGQDVSVEDACIRFLVLRNSESCASVFWHAYGPAS